LNYKTIKLQDYQTNEVRSPALVGSPHPRGKEVEDGSLSDPLSPLSLAGVLYFNL